MEANWIRRRLIVGVVLWCGVVSSAPLRADETPAGGDDEAKRTISFASDIRPILSSACFGCHQGAKQMGSLNMTDFDSLLKGGESELPAIVPGSPDESYLIEQIALVEGDSAMPPDPFQPLSQVEIDLIRDWISQGATNDHTESGIQFTHDNPPVYSGAPAIPAVDVSSDGSLIAVAGYYEVLLLDRNSGQRKSRLIGRSPRINSVRFSPDSQRVAAVGGIPGEMGEVQIWNVGSGELELSRQISYDALCGASWSPDGSKFAFGASDNVVRAIDTETGEQVLFQGAHDDWVREVAFSHDGSHLITAARDMTCKLIEVETERFVDNITSITPGALSGGLSSVVAHPQRDEIVIGGADGIAKVYRIFRQTERRIGDDANLVRILPQLRGRIFSVAINHDGTKAAAAATLDGRSEVAVWNYDFNGDLTDELKKIMGKVASQRNPEERKQIREYRNAPVTELFRQDIDSGAVFSIAFTPDDSLVVAASDGVLRTLDSAGNLVTEFSAVELSDDTSVAADGFDSRRWEDRLAPAVDSADRPFASDQLKNVVVYPEAIELDSPYDYTQLVVTAELLDGSTHDVTRSCRFELPDWVVMTPSGLLRPAANGKGELSVSFLDQQRSVTVSAANIEGHENGAVDFIRDVNPVLSRLGCNQGTCHGAQKGKNGFKLSLRGYDATYDIRALTDDLAARRINRSAPEASLMLRKPLGRTPHQGGTLIAEGDPYHTVLRRWIADGSVLNRESTRAKSIEIFPVNPIVESTTAQQQIRIVAHFDDGSRRDVTREAFVTSGNTEIATVDRTGLLQSVRRGEAPILARYEGAYAATTLTVMGDRDGYQEVAVDAWSDIDRLVAEKWRRMKIMPSETCDDATFLRRVHLDLTGMPPTSGQVRAFLADPMTTQLKRARVIDELIGSQAYIDYWTNKWADLLQVNRKYLGVEGSEKFRDWIRRAVADNRPYDQFAREILTASGSNNDHPPSSYFKVLRNPEDTMENTTHLFLGIRFNCNKCHDHPFERWTQDQYYQLTSYFARVGLEKDPVSKDRKIGGTAVEGAKPLFEKVVDRNQGETRHPNTGDVVAPEFPFDVEHETSDDATRRQQLASWITDPDNPYFARSYVNRLWGYMFGVGLIEPIDDIRAGNPPTNPELLDYLTEQFVESKFDVAKMLRLICNSRTYQLSVATNAYNADDSLNFSHAIPRRLPAEVIYDAVHALTGAVSSIPGMPKGTRAAALTDSGVKLPDGFLQNLGRPVRESACECERSSDLQLGPVMALISGPTVGTAISDPKNELELMVQGYPNDDQLAEEIFLRALGRRPTDAELSLFQEFKSAIQGDHDQLVLRLDAAEKDWIVQRKRLETQRLNDLEAVTKLVAERTKETQPLHDRLGSERETKIEEAKKKLAETKAEAFKQVDQWRADLGSTTDWYPLAATFVESSNGVTLTPLQDRSIGASGKAKKGIYTIKVRTKLKGITGFRLEAMLDPGQEGKGPGLAKDGNFILSEFEVNVPAAESGQKPKRLKFKSAVADFTQANFDISRTINEVNGDLGWAIAPAQASPHWAVYRLAEPLANDDGVELTFRLHQTFAAFDLPLGRFRISATSDAGELPLGLPDSFASVLATEPDQRSDESIKLLEDYIVRTNGEIRKATSALKEAEKPIQRDERLVLLEKRKENLTKETQDDPALVQLRLDVEESTKQIANLRLTAAEDLTWALVNSPAFLFNH